MNALRVEHSRYDQIEPATEVEALPRTIGRAAILVAKIFLNPSISSNFDRLLISG
jgi:hypothetical protein